MTAVFQKILVPIDFSTHAHRALEVACQLAVSFEASLTLFHAYVIPSFPLPEGYVLASAETVAELMDKTQTAMSEARDRARALGVVRVETQVNEGAAFAEIVRVARENAHDLIVLGTHGRTGLRHALLGSVAEKVVRKAHCAVLTIRDAELGFERP